MIYAHRLYLPPSRVPRNTEYLHRAMTWKIPMHSMTGWPRCDLEKMVFLSKFERENTGN